MEVDSSVPVYNIIPSSPIFNISFARVQVIRIFLEVQFSTVWFLF